MVVDAVVTRVIDHIVGHAVGVYGAVASVVLQDARSVHFVTLFDRVNMSCTFCVFCRRKIKYFIRILAYGKKFADFWDFLKTLKIPK